MKHSIAWHRDSLNVMLTNLDTFARRVQRDSERLEHTRGAAIFYSHQIDEAVRLKKDGFDADKFRRTKKGKEKCELPY